MANSAAGPKLEVVLGFPNPILGILTKAGEGSAAAEERWLALQEKLGQASA
jgi:hypothetical protein